MASRCPRAFRCKDVAEARRSFRAGRKHRCGDAESRQRSSDIPARWPTRPRPRQRFPGLPWIVRASASWRASVGNYGCSKMPKTFPAGSRKVANASPSPCGVSGVTTSPPAAEIFFNVSSTLSTIT